jgi:hypothetical protein
MSAPVFRPMSRACRPAPMLIAVVALGFSVGEALADRVILSGTHSKDSILESCVAAGGSFSSGGGAYGCSTEKGSVTCNDQGKCYGSCESCGKPATAHKGSGSVLGVLSGNTLKAGPPPPIKTTDKPIHVKQPIADSNSGATTNTERQGKKK